MNADRFPVKVSVCLQTYNHAPYIARALDSVLMQETDFEFEIIVGEDESSDGTRELCIDYARRHPHRIRLFLRSREDVIYLDGRPTGRFNFIQNLNAARGQYIALLDGDDYWTDPHKLQKQTAFLDSHPAYALCFHAADEIDERGERIRTLYPPGRQATYTLRDLLRGNFIPALSVLFRNDPAFHPPPEWLRQTRYADWPLHILNATRGKIGYLDEVMGVYRRHGGGITQHIYEDATAPALVRIETLKLLRSLLADRIDPRLFDEAISANYVQAGRYFAAHDDLARARTAWRQALRWDKSNLSALMLWLAAAPGDAFFHRLQSLKHTRRSKRSIS
jgi:glycosyltransferase involved in cell wall biosynthesis